MTAKNVLIFPAGTEIALEIYNALKFSKFVNLYGGTSKRDHSEFAFKNLIDGFPYVNDTGFLQYLNNIIDKYSIEYVYPAHDSMSVFCVDNRDKIKAEVIITDGFTTNLCRSKSRTYEFFRDEKFIPKVYKSVDEINDYPVFVKPSEGQGSNGAIKVNTKMELEFWMNKNPSLVITEYLPGMEYTVDCFTDKNGNLRSVKLRDRERIRAGISVRSKICPNDSEVDHIANTINRRLKFRGAWFFQIKKDVNDEFKLMEMSPRIAGTMGLSRNCGINYPMLTLFDFWGYDVSIIDNDYDILVDRAFYSSYRINIQYDHVYTDFDDTLIVNDAVNTVLLSFLYQTVEKGKKIHLLSKHIGDIYEDLKKYKISELLFDEIVVIDKEKEKWDYISEKSAIFIDDSFEERRKIKEKCNIPVFDLDMIESLMCRE